MIKKSDWLELHSELIKEDIEIIYLCNDVSSLKWVNNLNDNSVKAIEIHATGINDVFLLGEACNFKGTVILGAGGSTLDEVSFAVDFLKKGGQSDILLMHGFQSYPTDYKDIVFSKMRMLENIFKLPIGYADHTDPKDKLNSFVSCLPQSMGFNILEKHFTLKPGEKRIDGQAAVSLEQMKEIQDLMQKVHLCRGEDSLYMSDAELKYGDIGPMKKAIVARERIEKGTELSINHFSYKRTNESIPVSQKDINLFIGCTTNSVIEKDEAVSFKKIDYKHKISDFSQFNSNSTKQQ